MNGPAPSSAPAAQPGHAGRGSSRARAVATPPASMSRQAQPGQSGLLNAVTPPWSATCTAATARASGAPAMRIA